ncbi:hypothetical protein DL93DRAFT_785542 [Clavulina sp. PMI_390]|nr:hypothetical protein DL93DRAFT_785542 [Clavulina sp. PMI_390]
MKHGYSCTDRCPPPGPRLFIPVLAVHSLFLFIWHFVRRFISTAGTNFLYIYMHRVTLFAGPSSTPTSLVCSPHGHVRTSRSHPIATFDVHPHLKQKVRGRRFSFQFSHVIDSKCAPHPPSFLHNIRLGETFVF